MLVNLDKNALVSLVQGINPYYNLIEKYEKLGYGSYTGGFVDKWGWNNWKLKNLSEEILYEIFIECRESWPK